MKERSRCELGAREVVSQTLRGSVQQQETHFRTQTQGVSAERKDSVVAIVQVVQLL